MPLFSRSLPDQPSAGDAVPATAHLCLRHRAVLACVVLVWATPLVIASRLEPDPRGLGTHQQLGLPPCTLHGLAGVRCPSCGMTTAWAHAVRGRWIDAVRANAGGAMLAAYSLAGCAWLAIAALAGRWWPVAPDHGWCLIVVASAIGVTLLDWLFRLWAG